MTRHADNKHHEKWVSIKEKASNQPSLVQFMNSPKPKVEKYKLNSERRQKLNRKLAEFISKDMRPINVIQGAGFKDFINELDPCYTLPTRKTLMNKIIPRLHTETMVKLQNELNEIKEAAVTTDGWTSNVGDKYNSYTIHYINWSAKEPTLQSKLLECAPFEAERGTSIELEKELERVSVKFHIKDKIVLNIADNASDIQHALEIFGVPQLGCCAHKINLIANYAINNHTKVSDVKSKLTKLAKLLKTSAGAKKVFAKCLKKVGIKGKSTLISFVKTRWNCVYHMFERAMEMKDALTLFFTEYKLNPEDILKSNDYKLIDEILPVLKPLYLITLELSGEKVTTLSKVIPLVNILYGSYSTEKAESKQAKDFRKLVLEHLNKQFPAIEFEEVFACSTVLDPRFKNIPFQTTTKAQNAVSLAKSHAIAVALKNENTDEIQDETNMSTDQDHSKSKDEFDELWSSIDSKPSKSKNKRSKVIDHRKACIDLEMNKYLALPKLDRKACPIKWWNTEGSKQFNYLFQAAKPYLCMPATSVPSERIFSTAGNVVSKRRNRLSKQSVNTLVTLQTNLK